MTPAMLAAIIASIPQALQLIQSMIADFQDGNSAMTEEAIISMQSQVSQMVTLANTALTNEMAAKSTTQSTSG